MFFANQPYYVAETTMPGRTGIDFNGASQSFSVLTEEYLFGKNTKMERMQMTTPVYTSRSRSDDGKKMDMMTTPVITRKTNDAEKWEMSFVMPSKYRYRHQGIHLWKSTKFLRRLSQLSHFPASLLTRRSRGGSHLYEKP
ncbi:hypothetical protein MLD38_035523 [Melastoma candidum]|uniref:Uncharacterized protein n=1 Tax=Melastoma candidum TaxID=119954 RepID=A0ACB9LHT2_9MYRT|nr:hypothetical protein MLD38_035523 [Melastoma candidum]